MTCRHNCKPGFVPCTECQSRACAGCTQAQESKRAALLAVPLTATNPKWLERFRAKAQDLLLRREFEDSFVRGKGDIADNEQIHVGEPWGSSCGGWTDDDIIEEACKHADWMRFKRSKYVLGEIVPFANAFAAGYGQEGRFVDKAAAAPVPREIPRPGAEDEIARIRTGMPDECSLHSELRALQTQNALLKAKSVAESTREYVKLSTRHAKLTGQTLEGKVRLVTLEPSGKVPLQGETVKPMLRPLDKHNRAAEQAQISQWMATHPQSTGA